MTAKWEAGKTYVPGSLVRPRSAPPVTQAQATNGDFDAGSDGWDFIGGVMFSSTGGYGSANCCVYPGIGGPEEGEALNQAKFAGYPGTSISATCMIQQGASDVDHTRGWATIHFYDEDDNEIGTPVKGNIVNDGRGGAWHPSTARATFPAGASYARCGIGLWQWSMDPIWGDNLSVTSAYQVPSGLVYKAVQDAPGKSDSGEPDWPPVLGQQVIDNEVIWEAVIATRLTWEAVPLMKSGSTEPEWPLDDGAMIHDGTIDWRVVSPRIVDDLCPRSKIVTIAANKVFAGDGDVVRFCATNNPRDWSAPQDAGYLPTGQIAIGESECTALGLYRGNLAAFTASSMQLWQVDPDPSKMVFLDAHEGVGTPVSRGHASVQGDLYFLSTLGVRSVSIAAGTANMAAGDIGTPVDEPVREDLGQFDSDPLGIYLPSSGQYWLVLGDRAWVFTYSPTAQVAAWGLYTFPWAITDVCVLGGELYARTGDHKLVRLDTSAELEGRPMLDGEDDYTVEARYAYADFGVASGNLRVSGYDVLFNERVQGEAGVTSLAVGYDENNLELMTDDVALSPLARAEDGYVPLELTAPSVSVRVTYTGSNAWELTQINVYTSNSWRAT